MATLPHFMRFANTNVSMLLRSQWDCPVQSNCQSGNIRVFKRLSSEWSREVNECLLILSTQGVRLGLLLRKLQSACILSKDHDIAGLYYWQVVTGPVYKI